ncbi:MAG: hypothetical protein EG826_14755 [Deltaproteobacteria bacterium]|nr:hypothetical protein [Deltaproteobacteria bacterium]
MKRHGRLGLKITLGFALIAFSLAQTVCAAVPGRYDIDLHYDSGQAVIGPQLKAEGKLRGIAVAVAQLSDARSVDDKKAVGWVKELDGSKIKVFLKTAQPTNVIADGIKDYLKKAGYKIADKTASWDLTERNLPKGSGQVIIGGAIEELDITCWTGVFSNDYKINMKLSVVVADAAAGRIVYKGHVAVSSSRTDTSFSEGQLGHEAGMALADALGKMFEGKTIAEKIKEAARVK